MKFRTIVGLIIVLTNCSCIHQTSKSKVQHQRTPNQHLDWNSGLQIETGPNLGIWHTDSKRTEYSHAHFRSSITNDTTLSINLQIAISTEYHFPAPHSDQKFKVILWPQKLGSEDITASSFVSNELELHHFLEYGTDTPDTLNITIEPNEKYNFTIGTLHLKSTNYYVSPGDLFAFRDGSTYSECEHLMNQIESTSTSIPLALKLNIPNAGCRIVACGKFSYVEH